jgi:CheY-like chemotaxis protein
MGRRVLVVDDDADIRETVSLILEDEGYEVQSAGDGAAALAVLRAGPAPDVILLDLMMPIMNGWQFREEQQRDTELARIPVVVLSADSNLRDKAGFFGGTYLAKPVNIEALLQTIAASAPVG